MITSEQIKAARAIVRMTVAELASASGVGVATIKRLEAVSGLPPVQARTLAAIKHALEDVGVEFVGTSDDRPGVRLTTKS